MTSRVVYDEAWSMLEFRTTGPQIRRAAEPVCCYTMHALWMLVRNVR